MLHRILLSDKPAEGGETKPSEATEPKPAPPAAAKTVANGKSESEIALEAKLEAERNRVKKLETDVAHLQDEAKALREAGLKPEPQPKKKSWLDGTGFED